MDSANIVEELRKFAPEDTKDKPTSIAVIRNAKGHLGYYIEDECLFILWFSLHPLSLSKFFYEGKTKYIPNPSYNGW
jgi:hypothetical protein